MNITVETDQPDEGSGERRKRASMARFWARALPGSVVVVAALTVPEFSVGAGDLTEGSQGLEPLEPNASRSQAGAKRLPNEGEGALDGVRYAPLLKVSDQIRPLPAGRRAVEAVAAAPVEAEAIRPVAPPLPAAAPSLAASAADPVAFVAAPAIPRTPMGRAQPLDVPQEPARLAVVPIAPVPLAEVELPQAAAIIAAPEPEAAALAVGAEERMPVAAPSDPVLGSVKGSFAALLPQPEQARLGAAVAGRPAAAPNSASAPAQAVSAAPAATAAATALPRQAPALEAPRSASGGMATSRTAERPLLPAPAAPAANTRSLAPAPSRTAAAAPIATPAARPALVAVAPASVATPPARSRVVAPVASSPPASAPAPAPKPAITAIPRAAVAPAAAPGLGASNPNYEIDIKSQLVTRIDGKSAGAVDFQQTTSGLRVRLGSIIDFLGDRFDPAKLARLRASSASDAWYSLAELQAQGIPISYDPVYDEFNVGNVDPRPKAGRKVHIDQISAPERGLGSTGIGQIRR
ncbi:hypothetical protein [Porphyrobacter sp. HT-58-2]|uniref:hypothetical protein n=1 Tax=Porphyrobacter sp. HT-58-2 TaxID=2023229 RepID=UPI0011B07E5E|nr:hypothetical protein [Porphyrobacter sp. HT-58-2]